MDYMTYILRQHTCTHQHRVTQANPLCFSPPSLGLLLVITSDGSP